MKLWKTLISSAGTILLLTASAQATLLLQTTTQLTSTNATTQLGRPSRNSVPQDFVGDETYPGVINPTVTYYYGLFIVPAADFAGGQYVEVNPLETLGTTGYFVSAYAGGYDPTSRQTNWLGDEGTSSVFPGDTGDFSFILPQGLDLVLVINTTGGSTLGLGNPLQLTVSNFSSSDYDPALPVAASVTPEPSSLVLLGTGLLGAVGAARRRFGRSVSL